MVDAGERLDVLKALGDNTRYAIYLELARSPRPLSTAQIADSLGLHGNTVRPHLERMKEVGLLDSRPEVTGTVGRPQKLYSLAEDAPSLGLEPPVFPMLARMLIDMARSSRVDPEIVLEAGRSEGRRRSQKSGAGNGSSMDLDGSGHRGDGSNGPTMQAFADLMLMQEQLGFDPAVLVDDGDDQAHVAFTHCPFAELAVQNPEIICSLHRGLVEGFIEGTAVDEGQPVMELTAFDDVTSRRPCRMDIRLAGDLPGGDSV